MQLQTDHQEILGSFAPFASSIQDYIIFLGERDQDDSCP